MDVQLRAVVNLLAKQRKAKLELIEVPIFQDILAQLFIATTIEDHQREHVLACLLKDHVGGQSKDWCAFSRHVCRLELGTKPAVELLTAA